jgi:hypothetical protein
MEHAPGKSSEEPVRRHQVYSAVPGRQQDEVRTSYSNGYTNTAYNWEVRFRAELSECGVERLEWAMA